MAIEVTHFSKKEQFVICFRWVDKDFDTHEDFIGIYNVDNIKADTLFLGSVKVKFNFTLIAMMMENIRKAFA